jgi:hypothetical protein
MRAYLLVDTVTRTMWLAFGEDPVQAAETVAPLLADGNLDTERFSVSGMYDTNRPVNVGGWWPHFTNGPSQAHLTKFPGEQR